jgi:hypothetical protein
MCNIGTCIEYNNKMPRLLFKENALSYRIYLQAGSLQQPYMRRAIDTGMTFT